jgi:hypothetical protein
LIEAFDSKLFTCVAAVTSIFGNTTPSSSSNPSFMGLYSLRSCQHRQVMAEDRTPYTGGKVLKSLKKALAELKGPF